VTAAIVSLAGHNLQVFFAKIVDPVIILFFRHFSGT
jgi:hypothetical protein